MVAYKIIPIEVGSMKDEIEVGIVDTNVLLLISGKKLEEWGAEINFRNQTMKIEMTRETVKLKKTRTGHWVLNMAMNVTEDKDEVIKQVLIVIDSEDYKMKDIKKLHRVFGHPTSEKLLTLLKDAGIDDEKVSEILKMIDHSCRICKRFWKKMTRPKTSFPKARFLNETVSIDLKPASSLTEKEDK